MGHLKNCKVLCVLVVLLQKCLLDPIFNNMNKLGWHSRGIFLSKPSKEIYYMQLCACRGSYYWWSSLGRVWIWQMQMQLLYYYNNSDTFFREQAYNAGIGAQKCLWIQVLCFCPPALDDGRTHSNSAAAITYKSSINQLRLEHTASPSCNCDINYTSSNNNPLKHLLWM